MTRKPTGTAIKDAAREQRVFAARAACAAAIMVVLLLAVVARMAYLQIANHAHFTTLSRENRMRLVAVAPPRGLVYDRHGVPLAENRSSYRLEIKPSEVEDLPATIAALGGLVELTGADKRRFHAGVKRSQPFEPVVLKLNLTDTEVARLGANRHRFPGVDVTAALSRHYPQAGTVHALGYVGRIDARELARVSARDYSGTSHIGKLGVEKYYEQRLHGKVGHQRIEINAQGRTLRVLDTQPPTPGETLMLSLDLELQRVAQKALGAHNGAVVAMDPRNGEILALVSRPTYDPNAFVDGIARADYAALRNDPDRPLFNRAVTGQYPPGSTVKPFMALAGLEYGATTPQRTIWAPGFYRLPGKPRRYRDWKRQGHGRVDMAKAITQSCDVYFYDLAHRLGIDHIHEFLTRFGLGARLGLDATGEASGLVPSRAWKRGARGQVWFPGETVIAGIGQGYMLSTPLQLASMTSTLAMHGERVRPHLLHAVRDPESGQFERVEPERLAPVALAQADNWDRAIAAMEAVVQSRRGTAHYYVGRDLGYRMAGKTGTAQVFGLAQDEQYDATKVAEKLRDHALFIGFAPVEAPRIAVAVVVENGGSGGRVAGPVARAVMDHYLLDESHDGEPGSGARFARR